MQRGKISGFLKMEKIDGNQDSKKRTKGRQGKKELEPGEDHEQRGYKSLDQD